MISKRVLSQIVASGEGFIIATTPKELYFTVILIGHTCGDSGWINGQCKFRKGIWDARKIINYLNFDVVPFWD